MAETAKRAITCLVCHVTYRNRISQKISEHVQNSKSIDFAVPEGAVTNTLAPILHLGTQNSLWYSAGLESTYFCLPGPVARP